MKSERFFELSQSCVTTSMTRTLNDLAADSIMANSNNIIIFYIFPLFHVVFAAALLCTKSVEALPF